MKEEKHVSELLFWGEDEFQIEWIWATLLEGGAGPFEAVLTIRDPQQVMYSLVGKCSQKSKRKNKYYFYNKQDETRISFKIQHA